MNKFKVGYSRTSNLYYQYGIVYFLNKGCPDPDPKNDLFRIRILKKVSDPTGSDPTPDPDPQHCRHLYALEQRIMFTTLCYCTRRNSFF
jgi:hypothetical protein